MSVQTRRIASFILLGLMAIAFWLFDSYQVKPESNNISVRPFPVVHSAVPFSGQE